ncbi:MAG: hypothetical protein U0935_00010 [Pirellulales bacterium]
MRLLKPFRRLWSQWRQPAPQREGLRQPAGARQVTETRQPTETQRVAEARRAVRELFPRLYDLRLEERQLLDAAPLAQLGTDGVLTIGAGGLADDGQADHFDISSSTDDSGTRLDVSINGQAAGSFDSRSVQQIRVVGSSDTDAVAFDPQAAPPGGLVFLGGGSAPGEFDSLTLASSGSSPWNAVQHVAARDGGTIEGTSTDRSSAWFVEYVGVERIDDRLMADARSFTLGDAVSGRLTGDADHGSAELELSTGSSISWLVPGHSLQVTATGLPAGQTGSVDPRLSVEGELEIQGGSVRFDAGAGGFLEVHGTVSVQGEAVGAAGGRIELTGERVFVRAGSSIDASGDGGGGEILLGGGLQGADASVRNAQQTLLEAGATLNADARGAGDGGRIIVWADDVAVVWGTISARGGSVAGDGGFVETSAHRDLVVDQTPDLRAPQGRGGEWLIDPNNLEIVSGTVSTNVSIVGSTITTTNDGAKIGVNNIRTALSGGASVTISTTASGTNAESGDILFTAPLDFQGTGSNSLTLNAHRNIFLNATISDSNTANNNDRLNLTFDANTGNVGGKIFISANISTRNGTITFRDDVVLNANVTLDTRNNAPAGALVRFEGAVDADDATTNNRTLTIQAGGGSVVFLSTIGATGALADLDITGTTISFAGDVRVDDQGGNVATLTGAVLLAGSLSFDTDGTGAADNSLSFTAAVNAVDSTSSNVAWSIAAGGGTVTFGGAIGGGSNGSLADLDVTAATIRLNGNVTVDDQGGNTVTLAGAVTLGASLTIDTDGSGAADNGLTFTSTVNAFDSSASNVALTITADGGAVRFDGVVGGAANGSLADLDVTAATIRLNGNVTIDDQGNNTATLSGAVLLATSVTFDVDRSTGTDNSLTFSSTVNAVDSTSSNVSLIIAAGGGTVVFGGVVGGGVNGSLAGLDVTAATIRLNGNLTVDDQGGNIVKLTGAVQLANSLIIDVDQATGTDNSLTFGSTVNAVDSTSSNVVLQVQAGTGDVVFAGVVGGGVNGALAGLEVTAASIRLSGDLTVDDQGGNTVTFTGAVILAASLTIDTDRATGTDNSLSFTSTVRALDSSVSDVGLTVNAGSGTVVFGGAVGGGATGALADLDVTASTIRLSGNVTVDDQGSNTVTFTGAVLLAGSVSIDTDRTSGSDNSLTFFSTVDALDASSSDVALNIQAGTGIVRFQGAVGNGIAGALADLDVTAATIYLGGNLRVDDQGSQTATFTGDVVLQSNLTIDTDQATGSDNSLTFAARVNAENSNSSNITLLITAGSGVVRVDGPLGTGTNGALADLDIHAATIQFGGDVQVDDQGGNEVTLDGAVVLAASLRIDVDQNTGADNSLVFPSSVDALDATASNVALTIQAGSGTVEFGGLVGAGLNGQLADLDVTAATIDLSADMFVTDQGGNQVTFTGAVRLAKSVTIDTDQTVGADNSVKFAGTVDAVDETTSNITLRVTAGTGSVVFAGAVGLAAGGALADLDVTAATIQFQADLKVDDQGGNTLTFSGATQLVNSLTIDTDRATGADNSVSFLSTVNALDSTTADVALQIVAGTGDVTLQGAVGRLPNGTLADLDITAQNIQLGGDLRVDDQGGNTVTLNGAVRLAASLLIDTNNSTVTDNSLDFVSTVNAVDATTSDVALTINAGSGTVSFGAAVGLALQGALALLDVTASTIELTGDLRLDDQGNNISTLDGVVVLRNSITIDTDQAIGNDNSLTFQSRVDAFDASTQNVALTIFAGLGTVAFQGDVGTTVGNHALADLDVTAATIELGGNLQVDDQGGHTMSFNGHVRLTGNVTIDTEQGGGPDNSVLFLSTVDAEDATANDVALTILADSGTVEFQGAVGLGPNGALADLDVTASTIRLGDSLRVDDQGGNEITFDGEVRLVASLTIDTDRGSGADNSLTFLAPVSAADASTTNVALQIQAGGGVVDFRGTVGAVPGGALADLDVTAAAIQLHADVVVDDQGGNEVTFTGQVNLFASLVIDTDLASGLDNSLSFTGAIDADDSSSTNIALLLQAGTGQVAIKGNVGQGTNGALADLDVVAATLRLGGTLRIDDQGGNTITLSSAVLLTDNVSFDTDQAAGADNSLTFLGTVDAENATTGDVALSIQAGDGTVQFDDNLGFATNGSLADLDITAAVIRFDGNVRVDDQGGNTATLNGAVRLTGNHLFDTNRAASPDNSLTFGGTVDAADASLSDVHVTVDAGTGTVQFRNAIGGQPNGALAELDVTAATIQLGGNVTVDDQGGNVSNWSGAVVLAANVQFDSDGTAADNSWQFGGPVSGDTAAANRQLDVIADNGHVEFAGDVSQLALFKIRSAANVDLRSVTVAGTVATATIDLGSDRALGQLTLRGDLRTDGGVNAGNIRIQANGPVVLDAPAQGTIRLDVDASGTDGQLEFVGGISVRSATPYEDGLTLAVGGGTLDLTLASMEKIDHLIVSSSGAGVVQLGDLFLGDGAGSGAVGAALSVTSDVIELFGNVDTTGDVSGQGGAVQFHGTVHLGTSVLIDTRGATTTGDVWFDGLVRADDASLADRELTVKAAGAVVTFGGGVGAAGAGALAGLNVTGDEVVLAGPNVVVNDATGIAHTVVLTGRIVLRHTVSFQLDTASGPDNSLVLAGEVQADAAAGANDRGLAIIAGSGSVTFQQSVGTGTQGQLSDLDVTASVIVLGGSVYRVTSSGTNTVTFDGIVFLQSNVDIELDGAGAVDNSIEFRRLVRADDALVQDRTLAIQAGAGKVTFLADVGSAGNGSLADLDITAATIEFAGAQIVVNDGTSGRTVQWTGAVILKNQVTLNTDGFGVNDNAVVVQGTIRADDAALFDRSLAIQAGVASISLLDDVGTGAGGALADLDLTAATIVVGASRIEVSDATGSVQVTFAGNLTLARNVLINTDTAGTDKDILVTGQIQADNSAIQNRTLQITAGSASVKLLGDIGTGVDHALADLDVAASTITLQASTIQVDDGATATLSFQGNVVLANNVTFDLAGGANDHSVEFTGVVQADDATAFDRQLSISAGTGHISLLNGAGNTGAGALANLQLTASQLRLAGDFFVDDQGGNTVQFQGAVELEGNVLIDTAGAGPFANHLSFVGPTTTIDADLASAGRQLRLIAGLGNVLLEQQVGGREALGAFVIDSGHDVTLSDVTTSGRVVPATIHLGAVSVLTGQLTLRGNLRTDSGTAAGDIRIGSSGPIVLDAQSGGGAAGTIVFDTDLAASTADGIVQFNGAVTVQSAVPWQDGWKISVGSHSLDLSSATLNGVDHLLVQVASDQEVILGTLHLGDGAGSAGQGALKVSANLVKLRGDIQTTGDAAGGAITIDAAVRLENSINIVTQTAASAGNVTLTGSLRADDASLADRTLNIQAGAATVALLGDIGTGSQGALADLDVVAGQLRLGGASVVLNDAPTARTAVWDATVVLENNVTVLLDDPVGSDNSLRVLRNVRADDAGTKDRTLTVLAGNGTVELLGGVGSGEALADLDVTAAQIVLGGDVRVNDRGGQTVTFAGATRLVADIEITTAGSADNHLRFLGVNATIDGDATPADRQLRITAGRADVNFDGALGGVRGLGNVTITSARNLTAAQTITAAGLTQTAGSGDTHFLGSIHTTGPAGFSVTTDGRVEVASGITTDAGGEIRFAQGSGLLVGGNLLADGAIRELGRGQVTLQTNLTVGTTGDEIEITNGTLLTGGGGGVALLDTTRGGFAAGSDITLHASVDSSTAGPGAERLRLQAGTGGQIHLAGDVGLTGELGGLTVENAGTWTVDGEVHSAEVTQLAGTGATQLRGVVTTTGSSGMAITTQGDVTLDGNVTTRQGGQITINNGGLFTLNADVDADGAVRQIGGGAVQLEGVHSITTTGDEVRFAGVVTLVDPTSPNTTIETSGGNIVFQNRVDSPVAGSLILNAGATGDIDLIGVIGGNQPLRTVRVNDTHHLRVTGGITAGSFLQVAGTGDTLLLAPIETTNGRGIVVNTGGQIVVQQLLAQGDAAMSLRSGGDLILLPHAEVFVTGNAASTNVVLAAGGNLIMDPTARIRVGTGATQAVASSVKPVIQVVPVTDVFGASVAPNGSADVRITVGSPGSEEQRVQLSVRSAAGPFRPNPLPGPSDFATGREYSFVYEFNGNPGADPTSPIPILVVASFDPRIQLSAQAGAVALGASIVPEVLRPPASGLIGFNVIVPGIVAPPPPEAVRQLALVVAPAPTLLPIAERLDPGTSPSATTVDRSREIRLYVVFVDPQGRPVDSEQFVLLDDVELANLADLFQSLPDNRYRIYLKMENGSRRLIRDVMIRNRKIVELQEGGEGVPATEPGTSDLPLTSPENTPSAPTNPGARQTSPAEAATPVAVRERDERVEPATRDTADDGRSVTPWVTSLAAAATVLARRGETSWNEQVRRALRATRGALRNRLTSDTKPR